MGMEGSFSGGKNGRDMKLITHLHQVPGLRMTVTIFPLPLYVIMACTGTKIHITVCIANDLTSSVKVDIIIPNPYINFNMQHIEMFQINLTEFNEISISYHAGLSMFALPGSFVKNEKFDLNLM
jgi:hypothetical protein